MLTDTHILLVAGSEQHNFMLDDLAHVDRQRTPWLIVGGHRPMLIDSNNTMEPDGDQPVASALVDALEEAYMKYKVHMHVPCMLVPAGQYAASLTWHLLSEEYRIQVLAPFAV